MTSKEALERLLMLARPCDYEVREHRNNYCDMLENIIKKDLNKLKEYRKIEEEVGVDFITLSKALKGFYTEFGYISNEDDFIYLRKDSEGWYLKVVIHPSKPKPKNFDWFEIQRLKDYKKTWWLKEDRSE